MTLNEYLKITDISVSAFASRIGVTPQAVHRYLNGARIPRPYLIEGIKETTGGAVGPADWYGRECG